MTAAEPERNPKGFQHTIEDVPIFHVHTDEDKDWDEETLQDVVNVNNERYAKGEASCIIRGHTENPDDQPACVGVIDHLDMGERNGVPTIFATFHVDDVDEVVKENPFRSVEIDINDLHIPYVAVLSDKEPALELGTLFNREHQKIIKYGKAEITVRRLHKEEKETSMNPEDLVTAVLEKLSESAEFAFLHKLMEDAQAPEEVAQEEKEDDQPEDKEDDSEKPEDSQDDEDKDKEDDTKKLSKELAELKGKLRQTERERALVGLAAEGFNFDVAGELQSSQGLDDDQFNLHVVEKVRKYCKKSPVHKFSKIETPSLNTTGAMTLADIEQVKDYAISHHIRYEEALKALKK